MQIPRITFAKNGGPLKVELEFPTPQVVTYTLWLWGKGNSIVMEQRGNNRNLDDDLYSLPTPCARNHRRYVEVTYTLIDPRGSGDYKVRMKIIQDKKEVGSVEAEGTMGKTSEACTLIVALHGK